MGFALPVGTTSGFSSALLGVLSGQQPRRKRMLNRLPMGVYALDQCFKPLHFGADLSTSLFFECRLCFSGFKPLHFGADLSTPRNIHPARGMAPVSNPFISGRI